jgi:hypothetical protein
MEFPIYTQFRYILPKMDLTNFEDSLLIFTHVMVSPFAYEAIYHLSLSQEATVWSGNKLNFYVLEIIQVLDFRSFPYIGPLILV